MRMTAQIDNKLTFIPIRVKFLWKSFFRIWWKQHPPFSNQQNKYNGPFLKIWGNRAVKIPIKLDKHGTQDLGMKKIPFIRNVHVGLFESEGRLLGYEFCGSNIPIRSLGGKRYSEPTKLVEDGTMEFDTHFGRVQLEYSME